MHGGVPGQALELFCRIDKFPYSRVPFVHLLQMGVLRDGIFNRDGQVRQAVRNLFRHGIHEGVGQVHGPAHVPYGVFCRHGTEGHNLADAVVPVLLPHVVDDLGPPVVCDVDVDIGHGHPLRVQEALEDEVVLHRVDIRNLRRIGNQGPRRGASSGAYRNPMRLCEMDEVPDDQEIVHVAHFLYDRKFVGEAVAVGLRLLPIRPLLEFHISRGLPVVGSHGLIEIRITAGQAFPAELVEIGPGIIGFRHFEAGQLRDAELNLHVTAVRDGLGIVDSLRNIGEKLPHLLLALHIVLAALIAHAVRILHLLLRLNAEEDVVGFGVFGVRIVAVVRADDRNPGLRVNSKKPRNHGPVHGQAVVLQLQEIIIASKETVVLFGQFLRPFVVSLLKLPLHLAGQAGGQADQALVVLLQGLEIHPGLPVKALCKAGGHNFHQVPVAGIVLGQENQVVVSLVVDPLPIEAAARGDINLAADDRVDALFLRFLIEFDAAVHDPVVRDSGRILPVGYDLGDIVFDAVRPVEQGIGRMGVQVNETHDSLRMKTGLFRPS